MRSPHTPKLRLLSRVAQICRFTSQPYVRDVRQRRTSLTLVNTILGGLLLDDKPTRPQDVHNARTLAHLPGVCHGVGKTVSMLAEGRRRAEGGERVVIGWIERHGRSETKAQLTDLEVIAPRQALHRGRPNPVL